MLIDVTRLIGRFIKQRLPTGVDRVCLAYIRNYGDQARAVVRARGSKFVFRRAESLALFECLLFSETRGRLLATIAKGLVGGCLLQQVEGRVLFNTGHSGLESADYADMLTRQRVRPVFMVHDLIPITHPQFCRAGEQEKHLLRMRHAVSLGSGIVCNSLDTLDGLNRLCAEHGWTMPPAVVALLGHELQLGMDANRPVDQPYFVFVSTIEPRKNHMMILRVWQRLACQLGPAAPRLVIVGQNGWGYADVVDLLRTSQELKGLVTHVQRCSDAVLVQYLQHAQALLFPSFTEGFGLPVVEALALGVPVIASDLAVFREFASDIPDYLPATDEVVWANVIANYSGQKSSHRDAQLARMKGFMAPTWTSHFSEVDALLSRLQQGEAGRG
jgi:hypothetical protein